MQHKIEENAKEFFNWIEEGAVIYVCGDKDKMASDILKTIEKIVKNHAKLTGTDAIKYVKSLRQNKRYLEDIY